MMTGDQYRYISEIAKGEQLDGAKQEAVQSYEDAAAKIVELLEKVG